MTHRNLTGLVRRLWDWYNLISKGHTVALLPAGKIGDRTYVTDANATTYNSIVAGGGSNVVSVLYNGTNWVIS